MSNQRIVFRRKTLKLPCRADVFKPGNQVAGYNIQKLISVDVQKSVFLLNRSAVLCVRHNNRKLPEDLLSILQSNRRGLLHVLEAGTIGEYWYTIDRHLAPLPAWNSLAETQRIEYVKQMAIAVNVLHDTGYCHLDIKPEHFGVDEDGQIRLMDLDSAKPYTAVIQEDSQIEYTPQYASPEIFENNYSTASDYYAMGKSIAEWSGIDIISHYLDWRKIVSNLVKAEVDFRFNYTQLLQAVNGLSVEKNTGPRFYQNAVLIGMKKAYSDRQLALYLSQNYVAAERFVTSRTDNHIRGNTTAEKVARLIHRLDPALPLWWYGKEYLSTKDIATAMSAKYPKKDSQFIELLRTGLLLEFSQIEQTSTELLTLLQNAVNEPENCYWRVSATFGGRSVSDTNETDSTVISITKVIEKKRVLNNLIGKCLKFGEPVTVASTLESIRSYPTSKEIDSVITRLRAIPLEEHSENLTNITISDAFGSYIETRLPEPGRNGNIVDISELFSDDTKYLIRKSSFDDWINTNAERIRMRGERNKSIARALGWTALGIGFLAILPYILMGLAIIAVCIIILGILL